MSDTIKPVIWISSSLRDLRAMPEQVRRDIGQALYTAQRGETDPAAKPLKGFGGARVMEIVERDASGAYRARLGAARPGLWEFRFRVERASERFTEVVRGEVSARARP